MTIRPCWLRSNQSLVRHSGRVARWNIFKPKIPICVNSGGSCGGRCWYILLPFDLLYGYFVYFVSIWYILSPLGIFYGYLVYFFRFAMLCQEKSGNPAQWWFHFLIINEYCDYSLFLRVISSNRLITIRNCQIRIKSRNSFFSRQL
jgi:hypothetical protein